MTSALLFDTHIHFFDERYQSDPQLTPDYLLALAKQNGVGFFCNVGTNLNTSKRALKLAQCHDHVFAACGFHPTMVNQWNDQAAQQLHQLAQNPKIIAIGEIGLDFFHKYTTIAQQKTVFHQQLQLAEKVQKPVLLHIRQAYPEVLEIIKQYRVHGIVHCFSGTLSQAQAFIQLGFYISFSGTLTFHNAPSLRAIAQTLPLNKIVLETDAPYLAPMPFRGQINLPHYLMHTAQTLAQIKNLPLPTIIQQTTQNALQIFQIKKVN